MIFLAVDIGASSGRNIIGTLKQDKIILEEVYRFKNGIVEKNGQKCWDINHLLEEIKKGLKICKQLNKAPDYIGIDTWGVDFVLLDENNNILGNSVAYRDSRTNHMDEVVNNIINPDELYNRTGIQKQLFNSIYQLMAIKQNNPEYLNKAEQFLMIPDYLNYLLTGVKTNEFTNATTTQLVNANTKTWDHELIKLLGFNRKMFSDLKHPGEIIGGLRKELIEELGFDCKIVLPATHDTASAALAVPSEDNNSMFISSGTWSLMGIESDNVIITDESKKLNFTNSGGYNHTNLFLKNIMGLWMIQEVKKEYKDQYSFEMLSKLASKEEIKSIVDCNDSVFLSPESMIKSIKDYCRSTNQFIPNTVSEVSSVVYNSLAFSYKKALEEFERINNQKVTSIQIVGGGSQSDYLNTKTAEITRLKVTSGPIEATAIGNLICQMIATGEINNIRKAKEIIKNSFEVKYYESIKGEKNDK